MGEHWDQLDERLRPAVAASVAEFERVRPQLEFVTRELQTDIRDIFIGSDVQPLFVTARTKSVDSFRDKASRTLKPSEPGGVPSLEFHGSAAQPHGSGGVRVIVSLPFEIREAAGCSSASAATSTAAGIGKRTSAR